jgi:glutaredoxin-like protein NrdH
MITVYSKPSCVQCEATKRHLTKLNLGFDVIDITENVEAYNKIVELGFKSAPVVIADGEAWAGYQPSRIDGLVE